MWKGWTRSCKISEIIAKLYESLEIYASVHASVFRYVSLSVSMSNAIELKVVIPTQYVHSFKLASQTHNRVSFRKSLPIDMWKGSTLWRYFRPQTKTSIGMKVFIRNDFFHSKQRVAKVARDNHE